MKMSDDIVGVMQHDVDARICQHDACHSPDGEERNETDREKHRRVKADRPTPHGGQPAEDFHTGGYGNNHAGCSKICACVYVEADSEHVMCPHQETDNADRHHSVDHPQVAEDRLSGERRDDMADNAKRGHDHYVHLRMAEEPEKMLIEQRVYSTRRLEEDSTEVAIGKAHGDCAEIGRAHV